MVEKADQIRFPLYCERNLWLGWRDLTFPSTRSEYRALICMYALAAQHVDKGALFTDDIEADQTNTELASKLLQEAELLLPRHPEEADLDLARCFGFLALRGTQARDGSATQAYLGLYHGIPAQLGLHDEARWPSDLTLCDRELRRRLWWAMYRLEVHTSCVIGGIIRSPEAHCRVDYPVGLHHPAFVPGRDGDFEDWFSGWNITTDLYRVLEHAILDCRSRNQQSRSILGSYYPRTPSSVVTARLSELQDQLMPQFRAAHCRSTDSGRNRCGFQASNILCTIYLAQMVSSVSSEAEFMSLCDTVGKMMELVESIPLEYVRAAGSLMIQQLAGVGYMLVTMARKRDLREADLAAFRSVFTFLVDFLNSIQDVPGEATAVARRLEQLEASNQREALPATLELPTQPIAKDADNAPLYFMFPSEEQDDQHQLSAEQDVLTRSLIMSFDLLEHGSTADL